jgi:hypothetical protein
VKTRSSRRVGLLPALLLLRTSVRPAAAEAPKAAAIRWSPESLAASGFLEVGRDDYNTWLTDPKLGLELRIEVLDPALDAAAATSLWLEGLLEEPGFRLLGSAEKDLAGDRRALVRSYGSGDSKGWRTEAALILAPGRAAVAVTLLVPPGQAQAGEAAMSRLLAAGGQVE